ncbi:MAG: VanW family protein [Promicromonosporaceae bacterium]|nr:VanW family protein [Promicromonosporaceae bacterium]
MGQTVRPPHMLDGLSGDRAPSRAPKVLGALALAVVLLGGLYAGLQFWIADLIPTDTSVLGVGIGGLTAEEAVAELESRLAERVAQPVRLQAGEATATLDPLAAGLSLDARATVEGLTGFSWHPGRLWSHLAGGHEAPPSLRVDHPRLLAALDGLRDDLSTEPVEGHVTFIGAHLEVIEPLSGQRLDPHAAAHQVAGSWLREPGPIEVPVTEVPPEYGPDVTGQAVERARAIESGPVRLDFGVLLVDVPAPTIAAVTLAELTTITPVGGQFEFAMDGQALSELVLERAPGVAAQPVEAHFEFPEPGGAPVIAGGTSGFGLDPDLLADTVLAAASRPEAGAIRYTQAVAVEMAPSVGAADLEALGVHEALASASISLAAGPGPTEAVGRAADLLDGVLLAPGERISLLEHLAEVVEADSADASLSEVATAVLGAGFLAGLEIIEHHPHQHFAPHRPAGLEARLVRGQVDLVLRNQSDTYVLWQAWVADETIYVRLWGSPTLTVHTAGGERTGETPPSVVIGRGAGCVPAPAGEPGFTVEHTRTVLRGDTLLSQETFAWTYRPAHAIGCP